MYKLKRMGVLSTAKLIGITYAAIGLIFGAIMTIVALIAMIAGSGSAGSMLFGIGAIILVPLFYGAMGFISGAILAWIYNLGAKWTGGMQFEMVPIDKVE